MEFSGPVIGGLLIGLSAVVLLWGIGRIAGISGVMWQAMHAEEGGRLWRLLFLIGLVAGPLVLIKAGVHEIPSSSDASWPMLIVAGLLVGLGTRLGSGCTSGHGVCGMARLSKRSIFATLVFMSTGVLTVTIFRHALA